MATRLPGCFEDGPHMGFDLRRPPRGSTRALHTPPTKLRRVHTSASGPPDPYPPRAPPLNAVYARIEELVRAREEYSHLCGEYLRHPPALERADAWSCRSERNTASNVRGENMGPWLIGCRQRSHRPYHTGSHRRERFPIRMPISDPDPFGRGARGERVRPRPRIPSGKPPAPRRKECG